MKARVTICIPCFNAERWISQAVQSALAQTWPDVEVIVVDDGSTDGSLEKIKEFGDAIRVIAGGHRGSNAARNLALQSGEGEWIQFLDADDYLLPEKIARQFEEAPDGDVIFSPVWMEQGGKRTLLEIDSAEDTHALWLSWQLPQTGGALWKRSVLERLGGWNETTPCCQEFELYLRAIKAGVQFSYAPTPNAIYRIWSEQTLCRKDPVKLAEVRTRLARELLDWMKERQLLKESHVRIAGRGFFEMGRTIARFDLPRAERYHRERKREGLIHLAGPAAPRFYRASYRVLGFGLTERLAAFVGQSLPKVDGGRH